MNLETVLAEVDGWPVEDRLRLLDEVWGRLVEQGHGPGPDAELEAELDRRLAEDDAEPEDVVPWQEVKDRALDRIRR